LLLALLACALASLLAVPNRKQGRPRHTTATTTEGPAYSPYSGRFHDLHASLRSGDTRLFKHLLHYYGHLVNLNARGGRNHQTLLYIAVSKQNVEATNALFERGVDPNTRSYYDPSDQREGGADDGSVLQPRASAAPLHIAALRGSAELLEILLARGARINAKDWLGESALSLAVMQGYSDVVSLLLGRGVREPFIKYDY